MQNFSELTRQLGIITSACFIVLSMCEFSAYAQQPSPEQIAPVIHLNEIPQTDEMQMGEEEEEIAHPFFTHMGMPEHVGVFSLRLA